MDIALFDTVKILFFVLFLFFMCLGIYIFFQKRSLPFLKASSRQIIVQESLILDTKRRLVRIQNHQTEHLLLLGVHQDLVISSYPVPSQSTSLSPKDMS